MRNLELDKERRPQGRYRDVYTGSVPGDLPKEGKAGKLDIVHGLEDDPIPAFRGQRQQVAINRRSDVLENEKSRGRISEVAYRAANDYMDKKGRVTGSTSGGGQWSEGSRPDMIVAHEDAIWRNIEWAKEKIALMDDIWPVIGKDRELILHMALIDRMGFEAIADRIKGIPKGQIGTRIIAHDFRRACEQLGEHWHTKAPRLRNYGTIR